MFHIIYPVSIDTDNKLYAPNLVDTDSCMHFYVFFVSGTADGPLHSSHIYIHMWIRSWV